MKGCGLLEYRDRGNEIEILGCNDFDLVKTVQCGQCFRWDADDMGRCIGVAFGRAVQLRRHGDSVYISCSLEDFETIWRGYFDLDRDYAEICRDLCIDAFMEQALEYSAGIRILRQDSWEALCSFIISQRNNIPRIKKIISALCREFGDSFEFDGRLFHSFPSAQRLAELLPEDLGQIRSGYRAAYIINAAQAIASGDINLDALARSSQEDARASLKTLQGIGDKVADCALLYGLHMLDAFPRDVWVNRAISEQYGPNFDPGVFSPYAGIAQQYIFHYVRNSSQTDKDAANAASSSPY